MHRLLSYSLLVVVGACSDTTPSSTGEPAFGFQVTILVENAPADFDPQRISVQASATDATADVDEFGHPTELSANVAETERADSYIVQQYVSLATTPYRDWRVRVRYANPDGSTAADNVVEREFSFLDRDLWCADSCGGAESFVGLVGGPIELTFR